MATANRAYRPRPQGALADGELVTEEIAPLDDGRAVGREAGRRTG
ncbi:MAG TPA: hypothetical protein VGG40_05600 [Solirubrobacterales bacterium]